MKIHFHGAAGDVTGAAFQLTTSRPACSSTAGSTRAALRPSLRTARVRCWRAGTWMPSSSATPTSSKIRPFGSGFLIFSDYARSAISPNHYLAVTIHYFMSSRS